MGMKISRTSCIFLLSLLCGTLGRPDEVRRRHAVEKCGELGLSVYEAGEDYCCKCPRGKFKKSDCRTGEPNTTQCAQCLFIENDPNQQTYSEVENISEKCSLSISKYACYYVMNTHRVAGSRTENARCECDDGYYAPEDSIKYGCHPHSPCKKGFQPLAAGTKHSNTKCEPCPQGTFSDIVSLTEKCKSFSSCVDDSVSAPGPAESDVDCSFTNPMTTVSSAPTSRTFENFSYEQSFSTTASGPVICHCRENQQLDEKILEIVQACLGLLVIILISVWIPSNWIWSKPRKPSKPFGRNFGSTLTEGSL